MTATSALYCAPSGRRGFESVSDARSAHGAVGDLAHAAWRGRPGYRRSVFNVEMRRRFDACQGLSSPVWRASGRAPVAVVSVVMRVEFAFSDNQLDENGRFVDTDTLEHLLDAYAARLSSNRWTDLFDPRPTFEFVTRWLYQELVQRIPQLTHVSLDNVTLGVATTYQADQASTD